MKKYLIFSAMITATTFSQADTTIYLESDAGDYIGQGLAYEYNEENAAIAFSRNYDNGITVTINNLPGEDWLSWRLELAAPGNEALDVGVYNNAERFPFQSIDNPGLSFSGQGRGCNTLTGSFEILEVAYDGSGDITALNVNFEQHCEGQTPALRGNISHNITQPVGVQALGVMPFYVVCKNRTTGQRLSKKVNSPIVDCSKMGLETSPGDEIHINLKTTAE